MCVSGEYVVSRMAALAVCPALRMKCSAARTSVLAHVRTPDSMKNNSSPSRSVTRSAAAAGSFTGSFEALAGMDQQQNRYANEQDSSQTRAADCAHAASTDSSDSSDSKEEGRRAARRRRLSAMASWGKPGQGFPTPPSDTSSSKMNNVDF